LERVLILFFAYWTRKILQPTYVKDFVASTLQEGCTFSNTEEFYDSGTGFGSLEFVHRQQKILSHPPMYHPSHSLSYFLLHRESEITKNDFGDVLSINEKESSFSLKMYHLLRDGSKIPQVAECSEIVLKLRLLIWGDTFCFPRKCT